MLLQQRQITLTSHFEAPLGPIATERAMRAIGDHIEAKRATDAAPSELSPVWDLAVWRYLPSDPACTLNSPVAGDDDRFFTPDYQAFQSAARVSVEGLRADRSRFRALSRKR